MSGPFGGLSIPASGMVASRTWMDALSDNVANINTVRTTREAAFQERFVVMQAQDYGSGVGSGVAVAGVRYGSPDGKLVQDPSNPLADENGMVRLPDINLSDQMVHLMAAQRSYQLNVGVFERARDSYARALEIGRG